jgi:hypothetical protein
MKAVEVVGAERGPMRMVMGCDMAAVGGSSGGGWVRLL